MTNDDLLAGYNSIRKSLTEEEKSVLQKLTGKTKPKLNIETFFQYLKTYKAVYKFPNWDNLLISEKELIGRRVYLWYKTLLMFSPEFGNRLFYNDEDDLKLLIIIKGLELKKKADVIQYNYFLNEKLQECYDNNLSPECIKWVEIEIEKMRLLKSKLSGSSKETKFKIVGISIPKMVKDLILRKYIKAENEDDLNDWFKGTPPENPIPILVNANYFISIIADLRDSRFILNSKSFCYSYIAQAFLFNGEKAELSYIEKVMKPGSENRVTCLDKTIPDIQSFKTSI